MSTLKKLAVVSAAFGLLAATSNGVLAQKKYDPGASDTEIKIGNIMPYSGPASAYGAATVSRRILYVQAVPAALALVLLWLA